MNWGFRCLFGNCDGCHPQPCMAAGAPPLPISSSPGLQGCYSYNRPTSGGGIRGQKWGWVDLRVGHLIEADDIIKHLSSSSKMNADWKFLMHLFEIGRKRADETEREGR